MSDTEDFSEEKLKEAGIEKRFENTNLYACMSEIESYILKELGE